ncbi:YlxR family protein [Salinibacterium hongtaonis]
MVRLVERDGRAVADASGTAPGRGAWVHPTVECVDSSLKRRAFGRALRADGSLDVSGVREGVLALHQSESPHEAP